MKGVDVQLQSYRGRSKTSGLPAHKHCTEGHRGHCLLLVHKTNNGTNMTIRVVETVGFQFLSRTVSSLLTDTRPVTSV